MNNLLGSLGLDKVEADPNAVPDGKYPGTVLKSEIVHVKSNDTISHVITYMVSEGQYKGAQRAEWFRLGKNPVHDEAGNIASYTPTMSDNQKTWYKKRFVDLGIPEAIVNTGNFDIADLVGKDVTFGVKRNDGYVNINFVELRGAKPDAAAALAAAGITPQATPTAENPIVGDLV